MHTDRNSVRYLLCSHCGLLNIPERRTCKQCQAALDSNTQVDIPAAPSYRIPLPRGCMVLWFALMSSLFVFFTIITLNPPSPTVPTPGSAIYFRGNSIMLLRLVSRPPYEGIEVAQDGRVSRFIYPIRGSNPSTNSALTTTELEALQKLREQWCKDVPTFRPLAPTEPFYDLAFKCGSYTAKQAKVPLETLPPEVQTLVQHLPHPA